MAGNGQTILWRLGALERLSDKLDKEKAPLSMVNDLATEVRSLRRAIVGLAMTIAGSSVAAIFIVLQVTH